MDSPIFEILFWIATVSFYGIFFWSVYLAVTLKVGTGTKFLYFISIVTIQPLSLLFIAWYYSKYRTLKPIETTAANENINSRSTMNLKKHLKKIPIICPKCGFSRSVELTSIPPNVRTATCPACKVKFGVEHWSIADVKSIQPVRDESPRQNHAFNNTKGNPRHKVEFSSVFLALGFVFSALWAMLGVGMRNLGDGGAPRAVNGQMLLAEFWPMLLCIVLLILKILYKMLAKTGRGST